MAAYLIDDADLVSTQSSALSFMTNDLKMIETNGIASELAIINQLFIFGGAMIGAFAFDWMTALAFFLGNLIPLTVSRVARKGLHRGFIRRRRLLKRASTGWHAALKIS